MSTLRTRPYNEAFAAQILEMLADGMSLSEICRRDNMPPRSTVHLWIAHDVEGFADRYARARDAQAERFADEIIEISDDGTNDWVQRKIGEDTIVVADHEHIQRSKLRVDARKWLMARMAPKRYGDRMAVTGADGKDLIPVEHDTTRIAAALLTIFKAAEPRGGEATDAGDDPAAIPGRKTE